MEVKKEKKMLRPTREQLITQRLEKTLVKPDSTPATTFHQFSRLPDELQLMVWESLIQPRTITIRLRRTENPDGTKRRSIETQDRTLEALARVSTTTRALLWKHGYKFALHGFISNKLPIIINVKWDTLYFEDGEALAQFLSSGWINDSTRLPLRAKGIENLAVGLESSVNEKLSLESSGRGNSLTNNEKIKLKSLHEKKLTMFLEHVMRAVTWFGMSKKLTLVVRHTNMSQPTSNEFRKSLKEERRKVKQKMGDFLGEEILKQKFFEAIQGGLKFTKWRVPEVEIIDHIRFRSRM